MKQLLIETMQSSPKILEEATKDNGGRMKVKLVWGSCDEVNGNGRVYPEAIQDREIEKLRPLIEEKCIYCSADHPEDGKSRIRDIAALPLSIKKETVDGRKLYTGEALILNTEQGRNLQEVVKAGGKIGLSQRGWGDTAPGKWLGETAEIVQENYELKTFDFVIGQSTKGAMITEGLNVVNLIDTSRCGSCERRCKVQTKIEPRKFTEVTKETAKRVKVLVEVMMAKGLKEKGRLLTEAEIGKATEDIVRDSFDWRKWLICESLMAMHPEGEYIDMSKAEVLFRDNGQVYRQAFKIKDYNVKFEDAVAVDLSKLTEQKRAMSPGPPLSEEMKRSRRVAGLPDEYVPPLEEAKKASPYGRLTPQMLHNRKIAGLPDLLQEEEKPDPEKVLKEQKRDRRVAGLE